LRKNAFIIVVLLLFCGEAARGRSLELFNSYSFSAHGGLENAKFYNLGMQAMTLTGPGDSSLIMFHTGFGLDLNYSHDGDGIHHLRIVPAAEFLFFLLYVQAGLGTFVDLEDAGRWGVDLMCGFGLRLFLGDEYQAPSISVGGRLDYMAAEDYQEFVPSFMAMASFYID
jgi:hypothetical protein